MPTITIDAPTATLAAASLTALITLINLIATARLARGAEERAAVRALMQELVSVGVAIHEVVACTRVAASRVEKKQSPDDWIAKGKKAGAELAAAYPKLKYPLGSAAGGLRTLARLPSWAEHVRADPTRLSDLATLGDQLREQMDEALRQTYLSGRPPTAYRQWRVGLSSRKLFKKWNDGSGDLDAGA